MFYTRYLNGAYARLFRFIYRRSFNYYGTAARIIFPLSIDGMHNISIGKKASIGYKTWLAAVPININDKCLLKIGEGSCIGNFNHIYCTGSILIGKNVLTADKVYISDNLHSYNDIQVPILKQAIKQIEPVYIGDGSWLGENVCVIGATIGKNCVIGANSVVTKDIPDYCVAVGSPAKVIRKFNLETQQWEKINNNY